MSRRTFPIQLFISNAKDVPVRHHVSGRPWFIRLVTHYKCFSIQKTYFSKPARTRINRKNPESTGNHVQSTSSSCLFQPYTRDIFPRVSYGLLKK